MRDDQLLLKVGEVAALTGLSRTLIYERIASGELPAISIGRARRISAAALRAWVDGLSDEPDAPHRANRGSRA